MTVLETLQAEEARLAQQHAELSQRCTAARAELNAATEKLRAEKAACGKVWNDLAAVRASLREFAKHQRPGQSVTGTGELKAGQAEASR